MDMIEYFLIFQNEDRRPANAKLEVYPKSLSIVDIEFNWQSLRSFLDMAMSHDLSKMTFDEHPFHVKSIVIDYEKKRLKIFVGQPYT